MMRWSFSLYALFGFVLGTHTHTVTLEQVSAVINQITSIIRQIPCDEGQTSTEVGTRFEVIAPYRRIVTSHAGTLLEATLSPIGATGAL